MRCVFPINDKFLLAAREVRGRTNDMEKEAGMRSGSSAFKFWLALGVIVLIAGFAGAYFVKTKAADSAAAQYRLVGGQAYQSEESKQDADSIQRFGGTPAVIVAAYKRKLHNLLQGENLAYVLGIAAVILAGLCFRAALDVERDD